ncbi:MAG: copper homeostasis periplasmic binding protein CopC [Parvibaculum sp.]|jgi:methionine-rich copper-binding protein CopC|uniref:copper homeostasis periplasmic binding protein CopC n=1 Tax=Parvibaculum sp. TaxID=2024848 RepID=UPI00283D940B|nr:copper homeostasis periplasmic binding protein CopC [Parvibaculum sp.]MDR3499550.1 copper homeostasis periplasmic binding protein CopC [Parvibaculum sp.]
MKKYLILTLLAGLTAASPAFAHAQLQKADPAAGSMPSAPVAHVDLYYSEELEPHFSKAVLADENGKPVEAVSEVDPKDAKHLVLTPRTPLESGTFRVEWHAVSVDTHKTQGSFQFMVMP